MPSIEMAAKNEECDRELESPEMTTQTTCYKLEQRGKERDILLKKCHTN